MGILNGSPFGGLIQRDIHSAQLLQEEFTGSRGALVSGDDVGYATQAIQGIYHKGFPTG